MMKINGKFLIAAALLLGVCLPLFAQEDVDDNAVIRVLQTSYPKLEAKQIDVGMIKNLNNRFKINLKVLDTPAIMYLTWQRHRNQYRWWYERGEKNSLVFLAKRPAQLSKLATISRPRPEPKMDKPAAETNKAEKPRIIKLEPTQPKVEGVTKTEVVKPGDQPEKIPGPKPAEKEKPAPPVEEVVKKEGPAPKPEMPKAKTKEKPELKSTKAEIKSEEPKAPVEVQTPKEKEATREELQKELNKMAPSAKESPEEAKMMKSEPQPKTEEAQPAQPAEGEGQPSPFLSVPEATGPVATAQEFLSTLVMIVGKGDEVEYPNFLFRPSEMAIEVQERDFQRAVNSWVSQFDVVHQQIKNAGHVNIRRILLQVPQTPELERTTRVSLQRQVKTVLKVYNFVKIDLALDGQPAYITIGGLVQTESGWRVAGRIELVKQITVQ